MSVIATDQGNRLANYSNYGRHNADLAAPGSRILSTILHGQACPDLSLSGTAWCRNIGRTQASASDLSHNLTLPLGC